MMTAQHADLMDRLPPVRGRLQSHVSLARYSWFRTGGPAEIFFEPADEADLCAFLRALPADVPLTVLGLGSNILIRDGGLDGVVIRLGKSLGDIRCDDMDLVAGAGASDFAVANLARDRGVAGLEFLRGVPGSIGGSVRMNAGAYGRDMADILVAARIVDRFGTVRQRKAGELGFSYRHSAFDEGDIVLSAHLRGLPGAPDAIAARMASISAERDLAQPLRTRTGGSSFKNPPGEKAWRLIDQAGCRGLTRGDAQVSEKHTNFLINKGMASADDLEKLGEDVRARVKALCGIDLEWEIRIIGKAKGGMA